MARAGYQDRAEYALARVSAWSLCETRQGVCLLVGRTGRVRHRPTPKTGGSGQDNPTTTVPKNPRSSTAPANGGRALGPRGLHTVFSASHFSQACTRELNSPGQQNRCAFFCSSVLHPQHPPSISAIPPTARRGGPLFSFHPLPQRSLPPSARPQTCLWPRASRPVPFRHRRDR